MKYPNRKTKRINRSQPTHCSKPKAYPPSYPDSKESTCNFTKSRLFCTQDNDVFIIEQENFQLRNNLATLEVCHEDCSNVLHDICGVIHTNIAPVANPVSLTFAFNGLFRIVDEFGREVCQRQISTAMNITPPDSDITSTPLVLNIPFCIKCCDRPRACDSKVTYRLQVEGLALPPVGFAVIPGIRDVTWSAIVWENCYAHDSMNKGQRRNTGALG